MSAQPQPYLALADDRRTIAPTPWEFACDRRVSPTAFKVGALIWGHMSPDGVASVSHAQLSALSGFSVRTIERSTARLQRLGWFKVENRSRGLDKKPCLYRACHPVHGLVKRPRIPEQLGLTLVALARGPKIERDPSILSGGPDKTGAIGPDTDGGCTTAVKAERKERSRETTNSPPSPESAEGSPPPDWSALKARLKLSFTAPPPKPPPRRGGQR